MSKTDFDVTDHDAMFWRLQDDTLNSKRIGDAEHWMYTCLMGAWPHEKRNLFTLAWQFPVTLVSYTSREADGVIRSTPEFVRKHHFSFQLSAPDYRQDRLIDWLDVPHGAEGWASLLGLE